MAEIKSTLDLIMERTKHLTLSPEEREAFRKKEVKTRIGATIQQYLDASKTLDQTVEELSSLTGNDQDLRHSIREEIASRLDPLGDNVALFELTAEVLPEDVTLFQKRCREVAEELTHLREERIRTLLNELSHGGIAGSALIPNLEKDKKWQKLVEEAVYHLREELISPSQIN